MGDEESRDLVFAEIPAGLLRVDQLGKFLRKTAPSRYRELGQRIPNLDALTGYELGPVQAEPGLVEEKGLLHVKLEVCFAALSDVVAARASVCKKVDSRLIGAKRLRYLSAAVNLLSTASIIVVLANNLGVEKAYVGALINLLSSLLLLTADQICQLPKGSSGDIFTSLRQFEEGVQRAKGICPELEFCLKNDCKESTTKKLIGEGNGLAERMNDLMLFFRV